MNFRYFSFEVSHFKFFCHDDYVVFRKEVIRH